MGGASVKWQFSNDAPIYSQLIAQIKVGIVSGAFPPGERLPSVRDLATEAGVNPKIFRVILPTLCYTQTQDIRSDCKGILLSKKAHIWNIRGTLPLSLYIRAPFQARFLQCLQTKVRTCLKPCQLLTLYEL